MKDTILYILSHIVDHPDDIIINETTDAQRSIFSVRIHKEDMGKVIGKQGRIIRAIRDLIKLMAAKQGIYADIVLEEQEQVSVV